MQGFSCKGSLSEDDSPWASPSSHLVSQTRSHWSTDTPVHSGTAHGCLACTVAETSPEHRDEVHPTPCRKLIALSSNHSLDVEHLRCHLI